MRLTIFFAIAALLPTPAVAAQATRPAATDSRILLATYRDREVYRIVASYGFQTTIEFSEKETVETISIGDSIAWQVVPAGNRVFLKPQEQNAATNMTVVTNLRPYYFELGAKKVNSPASVTFLVRFTYPDSSPAEMGSTTRAATPPAKKPTDYNFNYTLAGAKEIAPLRVFDDGEFTYMQFRALTDLPAIFLVDRDKQESVVNYRIEGNYVVIERTANQFSLRHGNEVACVYNRTPSLPAAVANSDQSAPPALQPDPK